jgi:hypothetical protein
MGKVLVAACLCGIIVVCGAFSPVLLQPASPPASRSTFLSSSVFLGWRLGGRAGAGNPIGLGAGGGGIAASPRQRHAVGGLSMAGPGGAKPYQSAGGSGGGKKTRNRKARAERRKAGGFILEDGAGPVLLPPGITPPHCARRARLQPCLERTHAGQPHMLVR